MLLSAVSATPTLSPSSMVVSITYNGGNEYHDMLVLGVQETPDGTLLTFMDIDGKYAPSQGSTRSLNKREIMLRVLAGQGGLPVPQRLFMVLFRQIHSVRVKTMAEYAAQKLLGENTDAFCHAWPTQPDKVPHPSHGWHQAISRACIHDNGGLLETERTLVVSVRRHGEEKTIADMLVTGVRQVTLTLYEIEYRLISDLVGVTYEEALARVLTGARHIPVPHMCHTLTSELDLVQVRTLKDFAAQTLLDRRASGVNVLTDNLPV